MDSKIIQVALNGLENILRLGEQDAAMSNGVNPYSVLIEECFGEWILTVLKLVVFFFIYNFSNNLNLFYFFFWI